MSIATKLFVGIGLGAVSVSALAHPDPVAHGHGLGLWNGLAHPLTGLDHLAVLVLLGAWMHSSGAGWRAATCLMGGLMAGVVLSGIGLHGAVVEGLVLASLPVAAAAVVLGRAGPIVVAGLSGMMYFHGMAHLGAGAVTLTPTFAVGLGLASLAVMLMARLASRAFALPVHSGARSASRQH